MATAQASLKAMEGIDATGLQTKINELSEQMKGKDAEIEKIKSDYAFDAAVKEAIRKASGRNEKDQAQDIETALTSLKKENDYLFGSSTPLPRVVSSTSGINNDAQTKREQANEALRNLFGKGE